MITIRFMLLFTVLLGVLYPLAITGVATLLFPHQAHGSRIVRNGQLLGSELIGQPYDDPRYFWPRPSATPSFPYNAAVSSGSNLGPRNPARQEAIQQRRSALQQSDPGNTAPVPLDLLTASGSGLDPHISPEAAAWQASRVARLRSLDAAKLNRLIALYTQTRQFGVLGEPAVNVVLLNQALDRDLMK